MSMIAAAVLGMVVETIIGVLVGSAAEPLLD